MRERPCRRKSADLIYRGYQTSIDSFPYICQRCLYDAGETFKKISPCNRTAHNCRIYLTAINITEKYKTNRDSNRNSINYNRFFNTLFDAYESDKSKLRTCLQTKVIMIILMKKTDQENRMPMKNFGI